MNEDSTTIRPLMLGIGICATVLMLAAPDAQAGTITDFLDRIGGCRKPMSESFSYEISPYTAKPYGKALAEWTDQDVADFRAYFVACQTRRSDWRSMGDYNRNDAIRVIDTAMAELRYNVDGARAKAEKQRADAAYEAEKRRRADEQRRAEAEAEQQRAIAEQTTQTERAGRSEAAKKKVVSFLQELLAFTQNELEALPPALKVERLDGYISRMQALAAEAGDAATAKPLLTMLEQTRQLRDQFAAEQARQAAVPRAAPNGGEGANTEARPFTDFEWLGQQLIMAVTNPLQRESFQASLARGIDFNVGVSAIVPATTGWLVQLSGRPGVPGKPGQGLFCRVNGTDTASLAVLRTVVPPYGIIHVAAPDADEFVMESSPLQLRIVFRDCKVTQPNNR